MNAIRQSCVLPARRNGPPDDMRIEIIDRFHAARFGVESFIRQHYALAHGADVRHFLPQLLVLRERGEHIAALGFQSVRNERLFLEQYLDVPVDAALAAKIGGPVSRCALVEVGNLVATRAGGARWLIAALTAYLQAAACGWAVFTAVKTLRNAFLRLGVNLVTLAAADPARLTPQERVRWGRYYETDPVVVAASVRQSFEVLHGESGCDALDSPWHSVYSAGAVAGRT